MSVWRHGMGVMAAMALALAGCSGAGDQGDQAAVDPAPSATCSALGEPRECSAEEYARDQEAQQAFREVSARYRAANEDINSVMTSGGEMKETPSLDKYARDQFLEGGKSFGIRASERKQKFSKPIPTKSVTLRSYSDDEVTVLACADGRDVQLLDSETGEELGLGNLAAIEVTAEKRSGEWFLVAAQNVEVEECD